MISIYLAIDSIENDEERDLVMKLYNKYARKVKAISYSILHNNQDADDALQNTFMKIIKYRGKFSDMDDAETNRLIVIITRCVCFDMWDKHKKDIYIQAALGYNSDEDKTYEKEPAADANIELDYLDKETLSEIKNFINELKTPAREIVIYKYFYDMKNKEIAELLGMNAATVGTILSRSLKKIRELLGGSRYGK